MKNRVFLKLIIFLVILVPLINSCGPFKPKRVDARNVPPSGDARVKKNIEEGRGFSLQSALTKKGGVFDFASSNELWRASLDTIDFMPLINANYSGGIIITDWYSEQNSNNESVKISIRFLSNEIRADALDIKVFKKVCPKLNQCVITETGDELIKELTKNILRKAAVYEKENQLKRGRKVHGNVSPKKKRN
tara:strand:+ start:736 stop:1311 length:576 start_codon:yes stop_codon:yes gene_type:complete